MSRKNIITRSLRKQADALSRSQQHAEAALLYERICRTNRMDVDARVLLAICKIQLGDFAGADADCRQALELEPGHALAHHTLGTSYDRQGRTAEAIDEFRHAIRLRPDFPNAYLFLANTLGSLDDYEAAENCYLKALELDPGLSAAITALGDLYTRTGRLNQAVTLYKKALASNPDNSRILTALGETLSTQGRQDEARSTLERAIRTDPGSYEAHFSLGSLLVKLGDYDRAMECYRRAQEIRPGDGYAIGAQAQILERRSEFAEAFNLLQPFIDAGSTNAGFTLPFAELSVQAGKHDAAIMALEQTLAREKLDQDARTEIHFKLGKILDGCGDYDHAFAHYKEGNDLVKHVSEGIGARETVDFEARQILQQARQCDKAFWDALPVAGNESEKPVYVVGMPRSGTTLTEQILASHPEIYGAGELGGIGAIARSIDSLPATRDRYPKILDRVPAHLLDQAARRHLLMLDSLSGSAARVVDKCPHNFMHLGLISILFPRGRIIHITRDPADTCLSIYFQIFTPQHAYACDLQKLGEFYLVYRSLMRYWNEVLGDRILNVSYEGLLSEPESTIRMLIEYCGLDWDDRCLKFHENRRDISTPSYGQVRRPLYNSSVNRWQHYRNHLDGLLEALEDDE